MSEQYFSVKHYIKVKHPKFHSILEDTNELERIRLNMDNTILIPDDKLTAQLRKELDQVVQGKANGQLFRDKLQRLVLYKYVPSVEAFANEKINTSAGDAVLFEVKNGVAMSGDAKITKESGFKLIERKEDNNAKRPVSKQNVFSLSGGLIETGTERVATQKKKMMGGRQYENSRAKLFNQVLSVCGSSASSGDYSKAPALEVLVSLLQYLEKKGDNKTLELVKSQLSGDTINSLAIILQPYKSSGTIYLSDELVSDWAKDSSNPDIELFCYVQNPASVYAKAMSDSKNDDDAVNKVREQTKSNVDKSHLTACAELERGLSKVKLSGPRGSLSSSELLAEAELRVVGLNSELSNNDYMTKYNLDKPYLCDPNGPVASKEVVTGTAVCIVNGDAFCYTPSFAHGKKNVKHSSEFSGHGDAFITVNPELDIDTINKRVNDVLNVVKGGLESQTFGGRVVEQSFGGRVVEQSFGGRVVEQSF